VPPILISKFDETNSATDSGICGIVLILKSAPDVPSQIYCPVSD